MNIKIKKIKRSNRVLFLPGLFYFPCYWCPAVSYAQQQIGWQSWHTVWRWCTWPPLTRPPHWRLAQYQMVQFHPTRDRNKVKMLAKRFWEKITLVSSNSKIDCCVSSMVSWVKSMPAWISFSLSLSPGTSSSSPIARASLSLFLTWASSIPCCFLASRWLWIILMLLCVLITWACKNS